MGRKRMPDAATDPLYNGGKKPSRVEEDDIAEDIATARWIVQQQNQDDENRVGCFTAWLQRKKPR